MRQKHVSANGAVVFWTAGPTSRDLLNARLESIGVRVAAERTDNSALENAMKEYGKDHVSKGHKVLVRANKKPGTNGYSFIQEAKEEHRCYHTHDFSAKVDEGQVKTTGGYTDVAALQRLFEHFKAVLTGASVGQALVGILADLGAMTLKDSGGIYWVPEDKLDLWYQVAEAVETSAIGGHESHVDSFTTTMDEHTARALKRGIVREIAETTKALRTEIAGGMGEKAMESRQEAAVSLHKRVDQYAVILEDTLDELHEQIQGVEELVTLLTLQTTGL